MCRFQLETENLEALMINEIPNEVSSEISHESDLSSTETDLQPIHKPTSTKRTGLAILGLLLLATAGFFGLRAIPTKPDQPARNSRAGQVTPVTVATVTQKTVPIQLQTIGTVQSGSTVSVTPQASGRITGVYFKKGQEVHKGDLLFTLDDRTQAASIQQARGTLAQAQSQVQQTRATLAKDLGLVRQAETTLAKDQAQAQFSQAQSDRYNNLYKQGAISQDQAQQYATSNRVSAVTLQADREAIANAQAVVEGDKAAIETAQAVVSTNGGAVNNAEVQSSYAKIYAPMDGRAGNVLVTEGNVVQANSTNPLVTIAQISPIQVSFSVPETNLAEIQKHLENGKLKVAVTFSGSNTPINGVLSFVNNTVDNGTGTIQLIGDFDNAQGKLFPGQFVKTTLTLAQEPNAIVVPDRAVQNGPDGQFVFVVNPDDGTVQNTPVTVNSSISGLDVVQTGLQPGDQVVTDGQANLVSGSKVRVKTASDSSGNSGENSVENGSSSQSGSGSSNSSNRNSNAVDNANPNAAGNQNSKRQRSGENHSSKPAGNTP
jgi:multidrug efflux system membrane fusion protein